MTGLKWTSAPLKAGFLACALTSALLLVAGSVAAQQTQEEQDTSVGALELPQSITLMGKQDPNLRKATAIVNGEVITQTDIDQRLALVILANSGKVSDEERERLRLQVLRNLIDETLKIQEAAAKKITVDPAELEQNFARIATNFKYSPAGFATYLRAQGSSPAAIKRQIEGEIAWSRLLRREVQPFINVSDDEVNSVIARLKADKGSDEFRIGEIYLSSSPEKADQVMARAKQMMGEIRQGGSFQAYARQYSEASTAVVGGDLGWVKLGVLPTELSTVAASMEVGQIAGPVPIPGGFSILYLIDKRKVLTADPRDALLSLKQVSLDFKPDTPAAEIQQKGAAMGEAAKTLKGCGGVNDFAKQFNAEAVENDGIPARDLPQQLQAIVLSLQTGQTTPIFTSRNEDGGQGVRFFVLCGRDDPADASQPNFEQIQSKMEEDRVNKRQLTYLRDLRRDAVIDYN